jgi:large subunit ribosomal protein L29
MKSSDLRELSKEELLKKEEEIRHELVLARMQKANQQLKNPLKVRQLRRDVARILTIINEKSSLVKTK